jgi:hypothetical protein
MVGTRIRNGVLLVMLLGVILIPNQSRAQQLLVQPERTSIGINEALHVDIRLEDGDADTLDLGALEDNFEITARARGSQVNIVNGDMSRINTWSLRLLPRRAGELTIPELCAGSACSDPIRISVSDTPQSQPQVDAKVIFEHSSLPEEVTVGQQIVYKVRLLYRTPLRQAAISAPEPEGVECEVFKLADDIRRETYRNGWRYDVIERIYVLVPQQSGTLDIPSLILEAETGASQSPALRFPLFEPALFEPFGGQTQVIRRRTSPVQIKVVPPLSTEHPWVPAQAVDLQDSWEEEKPELRVGEPATRTITLKVEGTDASRLDEIPVELPSEFRVYPEEPVRENQLDLHKGVSAHLRQSVAMVPQRAGTYTLPEITFTWWNMRKQQWDTARIDEMEVEVLPARRDAPVSPPVSPADTEPEGRKNASDSPPGELSPYEQEDSPPSAHQTGESAHNGRVGANADVHLWQGIAFICALGWLMTLIVWRRTHGRLKTLQQSGSQDGVRQSSAADGAETLLRGKHKIESALFSAAQQHKAKETLHLLRQWAAQEYPADNAPLETLYQRADQELRTALDEINAYVYASQADIWRGDFLLQALRNFIAAERNDGQSGNTSSQEDLPPLYPQR